MAAPTTVSAGNTIYAADINQLVNLLDLLYSSGTQISGGTAGTATLYQFFAGGFKLAFIWLSGFRTGGSAQTIALPTAFTQGCSIHTGGIGTSGTNAGVSLMASGVAQTINVLTALSATGGSASAVTSIYADSIAECTNAFDTIQFQSGGTANHTGFILLIGM